MANDLRLKKCRRASFSNTMKKLLKLPSVRIRVAATALSFALLFPPIALAFFAQTYTSASSLGVGTVVSINAQSNNVVPADPDHLSNLLGVVVDSSSVSSGSVLVTGSGVAAVQVSTLGGDIHSGDPITVSVVAGVGMKASTITKVLGIAQADFSASSSGATHHLVQGSPGGSADYVFGLVPVALGVADYRAAVPAGTKSVLPSSIQNLFNAAGGHQISNTRTVSSLVLLVLVLLVITLVVDTSIRSSIVSLGRNPLVKQSLIVSMAQVLGACLALLLVTLGVIYLIIR